MDKNLNGDTLKLVRFKILFVKRDYEDNIDGQAFTAWRSPNLFSPRAAQDGGALCVGSFLSIDPAKSRILRCGRSPSEGDTYWLFRRPARRCRFRCLMGGRRTGIGCGVMRLVP